MPHDITFKIIPHGSPEYQAAVALREEILRKPLGLTFLPEELAREKDDIQIAGFKGEELVATAVLVPAGSECKMQRVAVKAGFQKAGIGSKMMTFCENYAKHQGFKAVTCHACDSAVQFYLKNQYVPEGDYFVKNTIPHLKMRKSINLLGLGIYQHYKGDYYQVLGIASHTETLEDLVVYQALYGAYKLWVRPVAMFLEEVEINGQKMPRFKFISKDLSPK